MSDIFISKLDSLKTRQATILDTVTKIASCISDPEKALEAKRLAEELPGVFEKQNISIIERNVFNSLKLSRNEVNRAFLIGKAKALQESLMKLTKGLQQAGELFPEPKGATFPKPIIHPIKEASPPSILLPAQQLRDQILKKIQELQTPPPRTTGNIWENWKQSNPGAPPTSKDNDKDKDNQP